MFSARHEARRTLQTAVLKIERQMGEHESSSIEDVSAPRRRLVTPKRIAAAIGGITLVLVAIQGLITQVPKTLVASTTAITTIKGMFAPVPSRRSGMQGPPDLVAAGANDRQDEMNHEAASSPVEDSQLGPPPAPGCHILTSTDYGVFPPKTVRLWNCQRGAQ